MTIQPFGDRILIKPIEEQQVLLAEATLNEYGEVIAVGDACDGRIKVGDKVGFSVFGVEKLVIGEEKFYFIRQDSEFLLCTITD